MRISTLNYRTVFLISSAVESHSQQSQVSSSSFKPTLEVTQEPAAFKARRQALNLSTAKLASILGISSADVEVIEVIEAVPLGEEVAFLHNLTLALIELGAIDTQGN